MNTDLEKSRFEMKVKLVREIAQLALRNTNEEEQGVRDVRRKQQAAGRCDLALAVFVGTVRLEGV